MNICIHHQILLHSFSTNSGNIIIQGNTIENKVINLNCCIRRADAEAVSEQKSPS